MRNPANQHLCICVLSCLQQVQRGIGLHNHSCQDALPMPFVNVSEKHVGQGSAPDGREPSWRQSHSIQAARAQLLRGRAVPRVHLALRRRAVKRRLRRWPRRAAVVPGRLMLVVRETAARLLRGHAPHQLSQQADKKGQRAAGSTEAPQQSDPSVSNTVHGQPQPSLAQHELSAGHGSMRSKQLHEKKREADSSLSLDGPCTCTGPDHCTPQAGNKHDNQPSERSESVPGSVHTSGV